MTESTPFTRAAGERTPAPVPFRPGSTDFPIEPAGGSTVLLLMGRADRRWAADTAMELCAMWAQSGRRVVLADLHLESPVLHEAIGGENLEGVVDLFLYGASIARSARPVRGRGFFLIPAGTYEPDAEAIYHHPRWPKLVAGFRDANASLILFAPEETADLEALSEWVTSVVLLGRPGSPEVVGTLAALGLPPAALLVAEGDPEPAGEERDSAPVFASSTPPVDDPELRLPPPPVRPERRTRRGALFVGAVLALVLLLAGAGFLLARLRPELLPWGGRADEAVDPPGAVSAEPAPAPNRVGAPLPYSVQVIAYQSLSAAGEQMAGQQARAGSVPLFISPEEIDGLLYYKIFAGVEPDTAAANALRERLVAAGVVNEEDAVGEWDLVKHAPLAFDLGEYATPAEAAAAADSLLARDVPSYRVPVAYSDGSRRWQLYGGAYADSAAAEALRRRLGTAGVPARLVARIGTPSPPDPEPS
jgi:hypothetical protein